MLYVDNNSFIMYYIVMAPKPIPKLYTSLAFADLKDIEVAMVRYHCRVGNVEGAVKVPGGQGSWLIPDGAEIVEKKVGRRVGYRKKKND